MTAGPGESVGGYTRDFTMGYAYPRFAKDCEHYYYLYGSAVAISANEVAGGAINELWWNNKQFVNNFDYGRQIQMALHFNTNYYPSVDNPTEAGDRYGCNVAGTQSPLESPAGWAHGSPLVNQIWVGYPWLTTTTRPLQWNPDAFLGGSGSGVNTPVLWNGTMSKTVQVDFDGDSQIIKFTSQFYIPVGHDYYSPEIVSAFLTGDFQQVYSINAAGWTIAQIPLTVGTCSDPSTQSLQRVTTGGIVATTNDHQFALGIYRKNANNLFLICDSAQGHSGKYDPQSMQISLAERSYTGVSAGTETYTSYLVVGTLDDVFNKMISLYSSGY